MLLKSQLHRLRRGFGKSHKSNKVLLMAVGLLSNTGFADLTATTGHHQQSKMLSRSRNYPPHYTFFYDCKARFIS